MAAINRPAGQVRINQRLETFLVRKLGFENVEFYEQEACVEYLPGFKLNPMAKYPWKIMIICRDRFYLTENPPKSLDNFICFDDISEIRMDDEMPKFFGGKDKENSMHVVIRYMDNPRKKRELLELKNKIVSLKKSMIYSKMIDDKFVFSELTTPRSFRSADFGLDDGLSYLDDQQLLFTGRSYNSDSYLLPVPVARPLTTATTADDQQLLLLTNRSTNKSVHFDEEQQEAAQPVPLILPPPPLDLKDLSSARDDEAASRKSAAPGGVDSPSDRAVNERYKKLINLVDQVKKTNRDTNSLSLSLPLSSARSALNQNELEEFENYSLLDPSARLIRAEAELEDQYDRKFIQDCDKVEKTMNIYFLDPNTKMIKTLKTAHFNSKIRATLNYHKTADTDSTVLKMVRKRSEMEKKFKELRAEIVQNVDDIDNLSRLVDELLCAANSYPMIKKFFWDTPELYQILVAQILRYLPQSPANLKIAKAKHRRIQELESAILFVECLSVMINETEFYANRNEILSFEKCKLLRRVIVALLNDPETVQVTELDEDQLEIQRKINQLVYDLALVVGVLLWEILNFLKLAPWKDDNFNFDVCVEMIDGCAFAPLFLKRLVSEMERIINKINLVVISAQQTVVFYKIFSLMRFVALGAKKSKCFRTRLQQDYQEEFKYYFSEDRLRAKCFSYYPIVDDLIQTIRKLEVIF